MKEYISVLVLSHPFSLARTVYTSNMRRWPRQITTTRSETTSRHWSGKRTEREALEILLRIWRSGTLFPPTIRDKVYHDAGWSAATGGHSSAKLGPGSSAFVVTTNVHSWGAQSGTIVEPDGWQPIHAGGQIVNEATDKDRRPMLGNRSWSSPKEDIPTQPETHYKPPAFASWEAVDARRGWQTAANVFIRMRECL